MEYVVEQRRIERTPVLFVRKETPIAGIAAALASAYGAIWPHAESHGVHPDHPYARYLSIDPGHTVFEAGVTLPQPLDGEGDVQSGEIPACDAAVTTHIGPYDEMEPAYVAVKAWMAANDREEGGPPYEFYFSDPASEPDPRKWRTEVVWPLA